MSEHPSLLQFSLTRLCVCVCATNITIRNSVLHMTNLAVRLKTSRGRGGGIEDFLYENLTGSTNGGIQLNTHYGTLSSIL